MSRPAARGEERSSVGGGLAAAGLYIHVPFCASICPYCDFAVMKGDEARRQRFVETLVEEIGLYEDSENRFETIYFGGGTPSMLAGEQMEAILNATRTRLDVDAHPWIGLEANPEDVSASSVEEWRRLGVSMISLGIQSFADATLSRLGRTHDALISRRSVSEALAAGFDTVSVDLIFGLPGQSVEEWRRDLDATIELRPDHVSCYQLTVHEKTVFGVERRRGKFVELADEEQADLFFETHRRLAEAGYDGYEVSSFASGSEHRSPHNSKYWDHSPYLGLGPSAHSFDGRARRWWNERKEAMWARRVEAGDRPVAGDERLSANDRVLERLMLGLRSRHGIDLREISDRYGVDLAEVNAGVIDELVGKGLLDRLGDRLKPTLAGMAIADSLAQRFVI